MAEFDELVVATVHVGFGAERNDGLVLVDLKIFGGVDEEGGAAADFFSEQGNTGAGVIECFDDDVFELVAKILFYGAFVSFWHLGLVGENTDGAEIVTGATFIGR